jgi:hypothetical protein
MAIKINRKGKKSSEWTSKGWYLCPGCYYDITPGDLVKVVLGATICKQCSKVYRKHPDRILNLELREYLLQRMSE